MVDGQWAMGNGQWSMVDGQWSDDGLLLEQFFQAARSEQIEDNGFTHRVMTRLPERQARLSRLWTVACLVVGLIVFTLIGGWNIIAAGIIGLLATMPTTSSQLLHLMLCGAVLTALAAAELIRRERLTLI